VEVPDEEDMLLNEAQRQQIQIQLRKQRNKRIVTAVASVVFYYSHHAFFLLKDLIL
jgi:hypothetical protein